MLRLVCVLAMLLTIRGLEAAEAGQVKIDAPALNALIAAPSIHVSGTVIARTRNLGVTVNDVAARLDLDHAGTKNDPFRWFAEVDSPAGRVKLKARLHFPGTAGGNEGDESNGGASTRHVQFVRVPETVRLETSPSSGIVPLDVTFALRMDRPGEVVRFEVDTDGNGTWDRTATSVPDDLVVRYSTPGIRLVTARVTMQDGSTASAVTAISAQSFQTMNALLKEVWSGFRQSLASGDVDAALRWFAADSVREKYRRPLTQIRSSLPAFAGGIGTIDAVWIRGDVARYLASRVENGRPTGYHVYFGRNANGLWQIVQF